MLGIQDALKTTKKSTQRRESGEDKPELALSDAMFLLVVSKQEDPKLKEIAQQIVEHLYALHIDEYTLAITYGEGKPSREFHPVRDVVSVTRITGVDETSKSNKQGVRSAHG